MVTSQPLCTSDTLTRKRHFTPPQANKARKENQKSCSTVTSPSTAIQSFDQAAPLKCFNPYGYCTVIHVLRQQGNRHKRKLKIIICPIHSSDKMRILPETLLTMLVSDRFLLSKCLKNNYLQHHFILPHLQITVGKQLVFSYQVLPVPQAALITHSNQIASACSNRIKSSQLLHTFG